MFELHKPYEPAGDQPQAIRALVEGIRAGKKRQTLQGVTGSGKTFTMANIIQEIQRPTLVLSHNKTLAAQLYDEFKEFFPNNAVSYFVSYYDYYQPEAYIPQRDIYIEKDSSINDEIDRLRLAATSSLISRDDVIVVASVSSIYGLGSPKDYMEMTLRLKVGEEYDRERIIRQLITIQYDRSELSALERGHFRVRGDSIDIRVPYEEFALRLEFWGDELESIARVHPQTFITLEKLRDVCIYPAKHFVMSEDRIHEALEKISEELEERVKVLHSQDKLLEASKLIGRTKYDMEMIQECGYCPGIENYSAIFAGRKPGEPPETLFDFFPKDFLLFVDESHVTIPQIRAMYAGDQARKKNLVEFGYRLPSALDNRPLKFEEWEERLDKVVFVSATPSEYEIKASKDRIIEQSIRPTGLLDPVIEVVPASIQIQHLHEQILERVARGERTLVTALTKRLAEDISDYFVKNGIKCKWLHSELDALERVDLLRQLRQGDFDVLVGVNLLREGLDLPEASLVAILDADKEGFLRSETSLIQTIGRCARNVNAKVILYGDKVTESMNKAIVQTERRRRLQEAYNKEHGITPETVQRTIKASISDEVAAHERANEAVGLTEDSEYITLEYINELEKEMLEAADKLDFERAAYLRDRIEAMRAELGKKTTIFQFDQKERKSGRNGRRGKRGGPRRTPWPER
ncbi:MAG: excinuclease ABC subunit UvrB [Planctomycetia bacterium]|nr:excinuclease ABC subunit UvrB [Planctomycetia bacterium]